MATSVRLSRQSMGQPWGFRIHGGADFSQPLIIVKVKLIDKFLKIFVCFTDLV